MLYLVAYNSTMSSEAKGRLEAALKAFQAWWHHLDSTWIVVSQEALNEVSARLHQVIGTDENFVVIDVTNRHRNGWLPSKAWDWIRNENERERTTPGA